MRHSEPRSVSLIANVAVVLLATFVSVGSVLFTQNRLDKIEEFAQRQVSTNTNIVGLLAQLVKYEGLAIQQSENGLTLVKQSDVAENNKEVK